MKASGEALPVPTTIPWAPDAIIQLVKCGCKINKCALSYSCKTHGLNCTELCECSADEETCTNTQEHYQMRVEDSYSDDDPSI